MFMVKNCVDNGYAFFLDLVCCKIKESFFMWVVCGFGCLIGLGG